jgi:hypothetical protein
MQLCVSFWTYVIESALVLTYDYNSSLAQLPVNVIPSFHSCRFDVIFRFQQLVLILDTNRKYAKTIPPVRVKCRSGSFAVSKFPHERLSTIFNGRVNKNAILISKYRVSVFFCMLYHGLKSFHNYRWLLPIPPSRSNKFDIEIWFRHHLKSFIWFILHSWIGVLT